LVSSIGGVRRGLRVRLRRCRVGGEWLPMLEPGNLQRFLLAATQQQTRGSQRRQELLDARRGIPYW
jgi:hypothetical protein